MAVRHTANVNATADKIRVARARRYSAVVVATATDATVEREREDLLIAEEQLHRARMALSALVAEHKMSASAAVALSKQEINNWRVADGEPQIDLSRPCHLITSVLYASMSAEDRIADCGPLTAGEQVVLSWHNTVRGAEFAAQHGEEARAWRALGYVVSVVTDIAIEAC